MEKTNHCSFQEAYGTYRCVPKWETGTYCLYFEAKGSYKNTCKFYELGKCCNKIAQIFDRLKLNEMIAINKLSDAEYVRSYKQSVENNTNKLKWLIENNATPADKRSYARYRIKEISACIPAMNTGNYIKKCLWIDKNIRDFVCIYAKENKAIHAAARFGVPLDVVKSWMKEIKILEDDAKPLSSDLSAEDKFKIIQEAIKSNDLGITAKELQIPKSLLTKWIKEYTDNPNMYDYLEPKAPTQIKEEVMKETLQATPKIKIQAKLNPLTYSNGIYTATFRLTVDAEEEVQIYIKEEMKLIDEQFQAESIEQLLSMLNKHWEDVMDKVFKAFGPEDKDSRHPWDRLVNWENEFTI